MCSWHTQTAAPPHASCIVSCANCMAELLKADNDETTFYMQETSAAVLHHVLRAFGISQPSIQCHAHCFKESYGIAHHPLSRCWSEYAFANHDSCCSVMFRQQKAFTVLQSGLLVP